MKTKNTRRITKILIIITLIFAICAQEVDKNPVTVKTYPQFSLKCYSSLTKPDKKLICPAAR